MRKIEIFVLGNPLIKEDNIAIKVAEKLKGKIKGVTFKEIESIDAIPTLGKEWGALDAAKGAKKVEVISDLEKLQNRNAFTAHDLDFGFELKLMQKLGKIKKVKIIVVPADYELDKATEEVKEAIKKLNLKI